MKHHKKSKPTTAASSGDKSGIAEIHRWDKFCDVARACERFFDNRGMKRGFMGFQYGSKNKESET